MSCASTPRHYILLTMLMLLAWRPAQAVVPYRAPEDSAPSVSAHAHLAACRSHALQAMSGPEQRMARIESESFVQRGEAEYFRFLLRAGDRELFIICDGHTGLIQRQIDLWRGF